MSSISFTNLSEVLGGIEKRKKKLDDLPKLARQMGVMATNEIHPLTHKKSHNWDNTIHAEVKEIGSYKWELWVGSRGAFSGTGYNYGKRQEDLFHPIAIGWHKAQPGMSDLWNSRMKEITTISALMSDFQDFDFGSMGGI
jgi:hypothetical protein